MSDDSFRLIVHQGINPGKLEELFQEIYSFDRHVITVQVMAISDVSAAHKDAVRAFLERF